jgi:hypothetical protein
MPETVKLNERIPYRKYRKNDNSELKEPGYAAVYADEEFLTLRAVLRDSDIHSNATAENQPMWELGDVLEFFFWIPPRKDYYETQVSCNGNKLQIHLNEFYIVYDLELKDIISEYGMTAKVRRFPTKNFWYGQIKIPLKNIGAKLSELDGMRFMSGRYNYNRNWEEPELSATCKFEGSSFHSPTEWSILKLDK